MNRTFLSLYLLIVGSVIVIGWATEKIWQAYSPETLSSERREFIVQLEKLILQTTDKSIGENLQYYSNVLNLDMELLDVGDFSESSLSERILAGDIVSVSHSEQRIRHYKRLQGSSQVLSLTESIENTQSSWLYRILLVLFYLSVAVVIYFWVWPLARDLKRLESHAKALGEDPLRVAPTLNSASAVYPLASAFNSMSSRIRKLISTQKEMTHAISHELRTPLARMKFSLEAAMQKSASQKKELQDIRQDVVEMEQLISEFLNYAKLETNTDKLVFQRGEIEPLVRSLLERLDMQKMTTLKNERESALLECEWYLMERCLHNLIENAKKYCNSTVAITLYESDTENGFRIEDDGAGIDEAEIDEVFSAFYRTKATQESARGFGLGLALVKRIVEWHQGTIAIKRSTLGGACFDLRWPK